MLGTLVALAVARMVNLETFVWDMPTGVLRDVWLALSSLQSRNPNHEPRLERVWVRWHDNSDTAHLSPTQTSNTTSNSATAGSTLTSIGWTIPSGYIPTQTQPHPISYAQSRVEYPTLSVLPPLRSLSVLDIDEIDYLDEMSVLIAKSKDRLRELRVGVSAKAVHRDFAIAWDGPDLHQVDHKATWPGASTIGERRLGGVLGVLLGRVFDIRKKQKAKTEKKAMGTSLATSSPLHPTAPHMESNITTPMDIQNGGILQQYTSETTETHLTEAEWLAKQDSTGSEVVTATHGVAFSIDSGSPSNDSTGLNLNSQPLAQSAEVEPTPPDVEPLATLVSQNEMDGQTHTAALSDISTEPPLRRSPGHSQRQSHFSESSSSERDRLDGKLRLQTLELERISLSIAVLQKAFDWPVLTNLTILDCPQHDRLWIMLRRHFLPTPLGASHSSVKHGAGVSLQYHLNLKKIHTDAASPALISFLKETLAPNTLETLFLQDRRRSSTTNVTIVRKFPIYHYTILSL